jgi:hypothetical protein
MGPILILCSTNDELASIDFIQKFANSMWERGCQITMVVWDTSAHVGEFPFLPSMFAVRGTLDRLMHIQKDDSLSSGPVFGFLYNLQPPQFHSHKVFSAFSIVLISNISSLVYLTTIFFEQDI